MDNVRRERALAALGVVLLASVLACATFWVGRSERGSIGKLDPMSRRLIDLAGAGDPGAVRVLELAIRRRPVAYARAVFVALREQCAVRCDGIDGLVLAAFDRVAGAGQLRSVLHRGKWMPRFRRPEVGRPLAMMRSRSGYYRFPVGRQVTTVLLGAMDRAPDRVRGIRDLVGLSGVRRALCSVNAEVGSREADLRAGFCALSEAPGGDPAQLCSAVAGGAEAGKLEKLTDRQRQSLQDLCAASGSAVSSDAFAPTGLETLVGPGCVDMLEAAWGSGAAKEIDPDAALLARSLECMGVKEEPTRPTGHGAPGRGSVAFHAASDHGEIIPDPWRQPAEDDDGWSYNFNVLDPEANAANAAHVGDPGFIAVFAVESSAEEGTIAVEIVATSPEGDIGAVIVETGVPLDTLEVEDGVPVLAKIREGMGVAVAQIGVALEKPSKGPTDDDKAPGSGDWEEVPEESTSPVDEPADEKDGTFMGPLGDPKACRELEGMLLRGPSGVPARVGPSLSRPPTDPRASHSRDDVEGGLEQACSSATAPRSCGAVDCRSGLMLDMTSCNCRSASSVQRPSRAGCSAARCPEGTDALAVGAICTCSALDSGGLAKPDGPKPGGPFGDFRARVAPR